MRVSAPLLLRPSFAIFNSRISRPVSQGVYSRPIIAPLQADVFFRGQQADPQKAVLQPIYPFHDWPTKPKALQSRWLKLARESRNPLIVKAFPDNKVLADAIQKGPIPRSASQALADAYKHRHEPGGEDRFAQELLKFIDQYYILDENESYDYRLKDPVIQAELDHVMQSQLCLEPSAPADYQTLFREMQNTWPLLVRQTPGKSINTLLPLKHPYIASGGRYNEMYFWDSYFIILGLMRSRLEKLARGMVDNLLDLSSRYGIIPNGNRYYYLTRSQAPLITAMIDQVKPKSLDDPKDYQWLKHAYDVAGREYHHVWMNENISKINIDSENALNRYYDPLMQPVPECTKAFYSNPKHKQDPTSLMHERAERASGFDFTQRFDNRCADFLPVELNSILYKYEMDMARFAQELSQSPHAGPEAHALQKEAHEWIKAGNKRRDSMNKYLWSPTAGMFVDYDMAKKKQNTFLSLASYFPLWVDATLNEAKPQGILQVPRLTTEAQAQQTASRLKDFDIFHNDLLRGSLKASGEQWDDNGWPPLTWIALKGCQPYIEDDVKRMATSWLDLTKHVHDTQAQHTFFEKYNVQNGTNQTHGHYASQGPFSWTLGVNMALLTDILGYKIQDSSQARHESVEPAFA